MKNGSSTVLVTNGNNLSSTHMVISERLYADRLKREFFCFVLLNLISTVTLFSTVKV